jgi:formylglycine-generating enzyme required for sulfatase activity
MQNPHPRTLTNRPAGGLCSPLCRAAVGLLAIAAGWLAMSPARAVTIDWVTVGDAGNAADTTGYGSVSYDYRIGKYEITISQYSAFLNAVSKTDTYGLYETGNGIPNQGMAENGLIAGISRTGADGSYAYAPIAPLGSNIPGAQSSVNRPISYITWWDAARFANWMHPRGTHSGRGHRAAADPRRVGGAAHGKGAAAPGDPATDRRARRGFADAGS